METVMLDNGGFTLTIPKELVTDKLVQKLIRLVKFRELTQTNAMTEEQAAKLADEIQEKWWLENKSWFLNDVEQ